MRGWTVVVLAVSLAACVQSNVVPCGHGVICPAGNTCEDGKCVDEAQRDACAGIDEGGACAIRGLPGECRGGLCEPTFCGDGIKQPGEECDQDDFGIESCSSLNFYEETTGLACNADCTFDTTGCQGACGDGIKNGDELCDKTDLGTATCVTAGFYDAPGLTCSPFCTYDVAACTGTCGDGIRNGEELCDGAGPPETCSDTGFDVGRVDCSNACGYSFKGCGRIGWRFLASTVATSSEYRIHASSETDIWGVSNAGQAIHFDGMAWTPSTIGSADLVSIWTAGPANAWAVDTSGALWQLTGAGWVKNMTSGVKAVWGFSATDVWIAGTSGVQRWNGTSWSTIGTIAVTSPRYIHGSSPTDVSIASSTQLQQWNGTTWSAVSTLTGSSDAINAIYAAGPNDVWAVGDDGSQGVRWHWTGTFPASGDTGFGDGGTGYVSISGSASNDIWASTASNTGGTGSVLHWDGYTWTTVQSSARYRLYELEPGELFGGTTKDIQHISGLSYAGVTSSSDVFGIPGAISVFSTLDDYVFIGVSSNTNGPLWVHDRFWLHTSSSTSSLIAAAWGTVAAGMWIAVTSGEPYQFNGISSFTLGTFATASDPITATTSNMWGSSANDIWYAGTTSSGSTAAHVLHYNGNWSRRDITGLASGVTIIKVSGSGPSDVWALTSTKRLFHWTGAAWTEVTNLPVAPEDMVVAGPSYVILVGSQKAFHGDGSTWTQDTLPNVPSMPTHLIASGPDFVFGASTTEVFHYDGVRWSTVREAVGAADGTIRGIGLGSNRLDIVYTPSNGSGGQQNATSVQSLIFTRPWNCRANEIGRCSDGIDDDCDGALDARDADCP